MNYELAKELKDAGFHQGSYQAAFDEIKEHPERANTYAQAYGVKTWDEIAFQPTLEELIEACGEKLAAIERTTNGWNAVAFFSNKNDGVFGNGTTSTEAVARLWLALNKK